MMIGDAEFVTTPGELFPFTYVHDFSGPRRPAHAGVRARARLGDGDRHRPWRFIEGLGEDMLGYIFARSNAVGVPTASNPSPDDTDRFGCGHSDDGEAAAEAAGDLLCSPTRRGSRSSRRADLETGEGGA